jgi:DNA-binding HxlR family transcriptional regulator
LLKSDYDSQTCSIARSLEAVGERWSLLILRSVFLGIRRFDELRSELDIASNVLAKRLRHLVAEGILEPVPYQSRPVRREYRVTTKGEQLFPVLVELLRWGDTYYQPSTGVPRVVEHIGCGGQAASKLLRDCCGDPITPGNAEFRPGPGLTGRYPSAVA